MKVNNRFLAIALISILPAIALGELCTGMKLKNNGPCSADGTDCTPVISPEGDHCEGKWIVTSPADPDELVLEEGSRTSNAYQDEEPNTTVCCPQFNCAFVDTPGNPSCEQGLQGGNLTFLQSHENADACTKRPLVTNPKK